MTTFDFEAIGTKWRIDIYKELSSEEEAFLLSSVRERIDAFDKTYSRFRSDSLVTRMSKESGEFSLPPDADPMFSMYKKMYDISQGLVTPLVGQMLVDAGYDETYSLEKKKELETPLLWEEVMEWKNPTLLMKKPALLDFGAAGKGYLVDIVAELLEFQGISGYCVDAGGDMRHRSGEAHALKVGLENPFDTSEVLGIVTLSNMSLCASAGNRRAWNNMHHIMNPETRSSENSIRAVWVLAKTTIQSDILATGLFFVSPEKLLKYFDFEYLVMREDGSIVKSAGFTGELFTE